MNDDLGGPLTLAQGVTPGVTKDQPERTRTRPATADAPDPMNTGETAPVGANP